MEILIDAINARVADYTRGLDAALDSIENDPEAYDKVYTLREAIELVRCLRRVVHDLPINSIHKAFGAPGDFGYDTPIGDALSRLYRSASGTVAKNRDTEILDALQDAFGKLPAGEFDALLERELSNRQLAKSLGIENARAM